MELHGPQFTGGYAVYRCLVEYAFESEFDFDFEKRYESAGRFMTEADGFSLTIRDCCDNTAP